MSPPSASKPRSHHRMNSSALPRPARKSRKRRTKSSNAQMGEEEYMSKEGPLEVVETGIEIVPERGIDLNTDKFKAIMQFSEQTEKIGRALDNIRKFVLARALPGDWVRHGDNLNLTGPASERVLSALGLMGVEASFMNWRYWKDTGTVKIGDYFVWYYEAD